MNQEHQENIVKDLLYEHSAREKLALLDKKKKTNTFIIRSIAAIGLILILFTTVNLLNDHNLDRQLLASNYYSFPTVSKSRSADLNKVDALLTKIQNKEYNNVLAALQNDNLTEYDLFVKVNILFALDSLESADSIIASVKWEDEFNIESVNWVSFLIAVKQNSNKKELFALIPGLSDQYQIKAKELLGELK